ncbi:hypothetical protein [Streptomyces vinaceus]|uniref:hypothetical protein n=1 Tax=Streptomyces vinaceus TaxID=1960 RepID=UPI0036B84DF9
MTTPIPDAPDPWYQLPEGEDSWNLDSTGQRYRMNLPYGTDPFHAFGTTFDDVWQEFNGHLGTPPPGDDGTGLGPDLPDAASPAVDTATVTAALDATAARIPQAAATLPPDHVNPWMAGMLLSTATPADSGTQPLQDLLTDIAGPYHPHSWDSHSGTDLHYAAGYTDQELLLDYEPPAEAPPWDSGQAQAPGTGTWTEPLAPPNTNDPASRPWPLDARYPEGLSLPAPPAPAAGKRPRDHASTTEPAHTPRKRPRHDNPTQTTHPGPTPHQPTTAGTAGTAGTAQEWLLSAALSNGALTEIVNAGTASGRFPHCSVVRLRNAIRILGADLGLVGTADEIRHELRGQLRAGKLRDPGTYGSPPQATAAARPHPPAIPADPVGQWLLDAALSDLSTTAIARRAKQAGLPLPHSDKGIGARIEGMGHALGATGNIREVRSTLCEWRDAGLLVSDGQQWTTAASSDTGHPGTHDPAPAQQAPDQTAAAPHATTRPRTRRPAGKPQGHHPRVDTSAQRTQDWLLSAALSKDSAGQISANGKASGCCPLNVARIGAAFQRLGDRLGVDGTAGEIRQQLRELHRAGNLPDPGTYQTVPEVTEATRPNPRGIPTDPAEQWLLGAALSNATLAQIASDAQGLGWVLPIRAWGISQRIDAIGNALGATGTAQTIRTTLRQWQAAGHLVHNGTTWTVRDQHAQ